MEHKKSGEKTNKVEKEIGGSLIKLELKQKKVRKKSTMGKKKNHRIRQQQESFEEPGNFYFFE